MDYFFFLKNELYQQNERVEDTVDWTSGKKSLTTGTVKTKYSKYQFSAPADLSWKRPSFQLL